MTDQRAAGAVAERSTGASTRPRPRRRRSDASTSRCPTIVKALNALIIAPPTMAELKAYLRWHVLHAVGRPAAEGVRRRRLRLLQPHARRPAGAAAALAALRDADRRAISARRSARRSSRRRSGRRPRPTRCRWCRRSRARMAQDIDSAPWMSGETKKAAMVKLDAVVDRIGYPDEWRDYSEHPRDARRRARQPAARAASSNASAPLAKIGQPVDASEWSMTPPTVNAYYSPLATTSTSPPASCSRRSTTPGRDAAVNYGGAGAVIGHELTHGFDDQGRKFDGQGNLRDWWTPADAKAFEERGQLRRRPVLRLHGRGRHARQRHADARREHRRQRRPAPRADGLPRRPGRDEPAAEARRLHARAARVPRLGAGLVRERAPEAERLQAHTNPHSSNKYRVNGPLSNMPEFQKAFSCKADAPMVRANACRVW